MLLERYITKPPNYKKKLVGRPKKNKYALKFLSFRCSTLFDETWGSKFKGYRMEEMIYVYGLWYDLGT